MSIPSAKLNQLLKAAARGKRNASKELQAAIASELNEVIGARIKADRAVLMKQRSSEWDEEYQENIELDALAWGIWQRAAVRRQTESLALFIVSAAEAIRRVLFEFYEPITIYRCEQPPIRIKLSRSSRSSVLKFEELVQKLEALDARKAELLKLRSFMRLNLQVAAEVLQISVEECTKDWQLTRDWLEQELGYPPRRRRVQ